MAKKSRKIIKSIKVIIINILVFISIIGLMELFFFYKDRNETIVNCNMDMNKFAESRGYSLTNFYYLPKDKVHHCGQEWDYTYHIDNFGFRENENAKILEEQKVLSIGDSFTFGFGVKDNESYPYLLGSYNAGMWGNPFDIQIESFKRNIKIVKPRIVLWGLYPPHIITMMPKEWSDRAPGDKKIKIHSMINNEFGRNKIMKIISVWNDSYTGKYFNNRAHIRKIDLDKDFLYIYKNGYFTKEILLYDTDLKSNDYTDDTEVNVTFQPDMDVVYSKIQSYLSEAKIIAQKENIKIYFLFIPSKMYLQIAKHTYKNDYITSRIDQDYTYTKFKNIIIQSGFSESEIIHLEQEFLKENDWSKYYFLNDAHWNPEGNKFVTQVIKKNLEFQTSK